MTPKEARDYIIRHCNPDYPHGKTEWETAINMAIDALEKQTPKKPIRKNGVLSESLYYLFCPSCENYVGVWSDILNHGDMYNHSNRCICSYCGQVIDAEDIR